MMGTPNPGIWYECKCGHKVEVHVIGTPPDDIIVNHAPPPGSPGCSGSMRKLVLKSRWEKFTYDEIRIISGALFHMSEDARLDISDDDGFKTLSELIEEIEEQRH